MKKKKTKQTSKTNKHKTLHFLQSLSCFENLAEKGGINSFLISDRSGGLLNSENV